MSPQRVIAIVDDSAPTRIFVSHFLKLENFNVVFQAADGDDCIRQLRQAVVIPDLIILDIEMPHRNGFDTAPLIKAGWPSVKIIAMSSRDDQSSITRILKAGADQFLSKEKDIKQELLALIKMLLN